MSCQMWGTPCLLSLIWAPLCSIGFQNSTKLDLFLLLLPLLMVKIDRVRHFLHFLSIFSHFLFSATCGLSVVVEDPFPCLDIFEILQIDTSCINDNLRVFNLSAAPLLDLQVDLDLDLGWEWKTDCEGAVIADVSAAVTVLSVDASVQVCTVWLDLDVGLGVELGGSCGSKSCM